MLDEPHGQSDALAELQDRVKKLEKSVWRASKELTALRDSFAALKERAGIVGDVRPALVFKDQHGQIVPVEELSTISTEDIASIERVGSGQPVILNAPDKRNLKLQALLEAQTGKPLHIVFHGAMQVGEQPPRFERVRGMRAEGLSFCAIADPTIGLHEELTLGWYIGHNAVDLAGIIQQLVESLITVLNPSQVIFIGGSGGGFAALQNSARIKDSLAFVTDPQIVVPNYYAGHVDRLLKHAFDGFSSEAAMGEFGVRLSVEEAYKKNDPQNFVYYCQHSGDEFHAKRHLAPFAELTGVPLLGGESKSERVFLEWFPDGGHGPLRGKGEFERTLAKAKAWHFCKLANK